MEDFDSESNGVISKWNEGNFKNLRLHEAQEMINSGKVNPFAYSTESNAWNYQVWGAGIDILYGEGCSKYSDEEVEEVDKVKKFCETVIELKPPFMKITEHHIDSRQVRFTPIKENQKKIKDLLEMYEKIVKRYNDDHGLSTGNKDEDDWRGL